MVLMMLHWSRVTRHASPPTKDVSAAQMTDIVSTYSFREETVDVSGVKIHCVIKDPVAVAVIDDATDATDDVFVFIHGTSSASLTFLELFTQIPSNIKCVAIDLPNFGVSDCIDIDTPNTNEELCYRYADIIGTTLIKLDILKNTILVAHSLGGFLSIYVADRFPIKQLVLVNPAGILPTLGVYGYYWGMFFKAGIPTTLFHLPLISRDLMLYIGRLMFHQGTSDIQTKTTEFWTYFFMNEENNGHGVLQRLITLRPFYSYWNTPAINTLLDVYKKVPTHICFGEDDTIIPAHIGEFLDELTGGEIMIHNIKNASHNPCNNIECFMKYICAVRSGTGTAAPELQNKSKRRIKPKQKQLCRGYSYHSLQHTNDSFRALYSTLLTNTTYCPPHSA
jgi:pimeloyl-ACP methyl ester carboxylesterase